MAKNAKVKEALSDAVDVKAVWEAIPDFKMGSISLTEFIAVRDEADSLDKEYSTKDVELTGVKNQRDDKARHLAELITRFRSGMRSTYGPDSSQYGQAGGTRNSARKAPTRKAKAASAVNTAVAPQA
jgi:hypothetical protein